MINYKIFVDGSCRANKNGGIGIVWLKNGEKVFEYSKGFKNTTNNQMELIAIGLALKSIKSKIDSLEIVSDSEYAIGVLTKPWNPKKNVELISKLKKLLEKIQEFVSEPIKWTHARGHQKDNSENTKWNNYVDNLAETESSMIL